MITRIVAALFFCGLACPLQASTAGDAFVHFNKPLLGLETLVITPGYPVQIDGRRVTLAGNDDCPRTNGTRIAYVGGDPSGGYGCIVIGKETPAINVRVVSNGSMHRETWAIQRRGAGEIHLLRENGDFVTRGTGATAILQSSSQGASMTERWSVWDRDIFFGFVYLRSAADQARAAGYTVNSEN